MLRKARPMNPDLKQAKAIFLEAVEKHSPDEWPAFLDQACAGNSELRRRVEVLLEAHRDAGTMGGVKDQGPGTSDISPRGPFAADSSSSPLPSVGPGTIIGPYKLLQKIGEGVRQRSTRRGSCRWRKGRSSRTRTT